MNINLFQTLFLAYASVFFISTQTQVNSQELRTLAAGGEVIVVIEDLWAQSSEYGNFGTTQSTIESDENNCLELSPSTFSDRLTAGVCSGTEVYSIVFTDSEGTVWLESNVSSLPASFTVQDVPDGEYLVELNTSEGYLSAWATKDEE